jgi:hypothetical protein
MKALSPNKWRDYWTLSNDAFCACALIDLCSVRQFFKEANRWPELLDGHPVGEGIEAWI